MSNQNNFANNIAIDIKKSYLRFPFTFILSAIVSFLGIYFFDILEKNDYILKIIISSIISIPFSIAIYLFFESINYKKYLFLPSLISFVFVTLHFFATKLDFTNGYYYKISQLFLIFHLFISVSPFLFKKDINNFWSFNKNLLHRLILAILYSMTLFLGLSFAIFITQYLFDLNYLFPKNIYIKLWFFCAFIFQVSVFILGIPSSIENIKTYEKYPNGLKTFIQYIFIPLLLLYMIILYFYLGKILLAWNLPKGQVGWMVSTLGVLGILCILFLYPVRKSLETRWSQIFEKYFYILLLPLLAMLFLGVFTRIYTYGFTENRYFLLLLAFWLLAISLYFKISKSNNIKIFPISLLIALFVSMIGPWGAYQVSERSQVKIFKESLANNKILVNGKIQKITQTLSFEERKRISSLFEYIQNNYGISSLIEVINNEQLNNLLEKEKVKSNHQEIKELFMKEIGIKFIPKWQTKEKVE
ncbi:DUF4153 domain-containing protein [Fluviispira multicolorata]|uniref:DUF4153 domain-containing protein n=1 Tax=Fluviispira multicolorata TaxID=2654512 RepID=A0A833JDY5_9BACT|nr:DUF4153 domain-containing protein [Fluviispira multicolorata]KAB8031802.1 DUF4153 domain-containing protein [Fluviispira multicolorata]